MEFSAEGTWDIGYTLYNVLVLKVMFDHGYDVDGVYFWTEENTTGAEGDNMLIVLLDRVFEVGEQDEWTEQRDKRSYSSGYHMVMPVHEEIRKYVNTPLNEKDCVNHFLDWFEEQFIKLLERSGLDTEVVFPPFGGICFDEVMWALDLCWHVEEFIRLKEKADKYLQILERSEMKWQYSISA